MSFSKNAWAQLKNITADELISALVKDGFVPDAKLKAERIYRRPRRQKSLYPLSYRQ